MYFRLDNLNPEIPYFDSCQIRFIEDAVLMYINRALGSTFVWQFYVNLFLKKKQYLLIGRIYLGWVCQEGRTESQILNETQFWKIYVFRFDPEMLDDDEYEAMTEGDRQAAEALMKRRDREEGREGRLRRGLLYDDDDDDDEGMTKVKRRRAAEMAAMEVSLINKYWV